MLKKLALLCISALLITPITAAADHDNDHGRLVFEESSSGQDPDNGDIIIELQIGDLDVNNDETIDTEDENEIIVAIYTPFQLNEDADLDGDGLNTVLDLLAFRIALSTVPIGDILTYDLSTEGEINSPDGTVDMHDEIMMIFAIEADESGFIYYLGADVTLDGTVTIDDLGKIWSYMRDNHMEHIIYDLSTEGELNEPDGIVDRHDETMMIFAIEADTSGYAYYYGADLNLDGTNTIADLNMLWQYMELNDLEYVKYDLSSPGEVNDPDGIVDKHDEIMMLFAIGSYESGYEYYYACDLNADNSVTRSDLGLLWAYFSRNGLEHLRYDTNGDGAVTEDDRDIINSKIGSTDFPGYDMDLDGTITEADLNVWDLYYNCDSSGPGQN